MHEATPRMTVALVARAAAPEPAKRIKVQVPDAFVGRYVVESGDDLVVFEVGPDGVTSSRKMPIDGERVTHMRLSPDGRVVVYAVYRDGAPSTGALYAMRLQDGKTHQVASCPFSCRLAGVGADGDVWFQNIGSTNKLGPVSHVPLEGGDVVAWPEAFAGECALDFAMSPDGADLVVAVSNALGWPSCIEQGHQGFYRVSLGGSDNEDAPPKRFGCFTAAPPTTVNIGIDHLEVRSSNKVLVTAVDHWAKPIHDSSVPLPTWSCAFGADRATRADDELVLRSAKVDGKHWVVAVRADTPWHMDDAEATKVLLAGPLDHVGELAFRAQPR